MSGLFKTPKVEAPDIETAPSPGDEASRRAAELERRKRGKSGRTATILSQARRTGLPSAGGGAAKVPTRPTIFGR